MLIALGDALLGAPMAKALQLPRGSAREMAVRMLVNAQRELEGPLP